MRHFSWEHIPIVILSLLFLLIVIIPLLVVLLISPVLSQVINLTRIQPFLDEFQSCYRDSCRWYSIVYFIVWIGFVSMQSQAVPMIYIQTSFMILLSTHSEQYIKHHRRSYSGWCQLSSCPYAIQDKLDYNCVNSYNYTGTGARPYMGTQGRSQDL